MTTKRRQNLSDRAEELRDLARRTSEAAMVCPPGFQLIPLEAAEELDAEADRLDRMAAAAATPEPAVLVLPETATNQELSKARTRQSARRGQDVFLPSWSSVTRGLPDAFLRTALFSTSSSIQKSNPQILGGDQSLIVANEEIATMNNVRVLFSGYRLCQFDRQVYATCLDYYRERPLAPLDCTKQVRTSYYEFASRMGGTHNAKTYLGIRASLLRLSFAQIRMRINRLDIEVPKLLAVNFDDGSASGELTGADTLMLCVTESVAELFGVAAWTAIDLPAVDYDGLRGWLGSFYATHSKARWLPVETLYELSGYESRMSNFRDSLVKALDKLKEPGTPDCSRVARYSFDEKKEKVLVVLERWSRH